MNKFVNILLLLLLFPTMLLVIYVGFDLPVEFLKTTGSQIPFHEEIMLAFAALFLLIGARRSVRRWMGLRLVGQTHKYIWNVPIDAGRIKQANLYLVLEGVVHLAAAYACFAITPKALPIAGVIALLGLDHFVFALVGSTKNKFRIGMTSKALVVADRDVKVIYFSGLRRVSTQQQSLFFDYVEELQLSLPINSFSDEDRGVFIQRLEQVVNRDKVFFSDSVKAWKN